VVEFTPSTLKSFVAIAPLDFVQGEERRMTAERKTE